MWDEYLYGVLEKFAVRVTVCESVCVVCVVEREMMMKGRERVKPGAGS